MNTKFEPKIQSHKELKNAQNVCALTEIKPTIFCYEGWCAETSLESTFANPFWVISYRS